MEDLKKHITESLQLLAGKTINLKDGISGGVIDEFLGVWGVADCFGMEEECVSFYNFVAGLKNDLYKLSSINIYEAVALVIFGDERFEFNEHSLFDLNILFTSRLYIINALLRFQALRDDFYELEELTKAAALDYYDNRIPGNPSRKYKMNLRILPPGSMDDVKSKWIKTATALIPPLAILFGTLALQDPASMSETDTVLTNCIWPCLISAVIGFIVGIGICGKINSKKEEERNNVKLENDKEIKRWEKEVMLAFSEKSKDIDFLSKNIDEYINALKKSDALLFEYMSQAFGFIPEKYLFDQDAVSAFYDYLKDRRVDSMKEAINLYVAEKNTAGFRDRQICIQQEIAAVAETAVRDARRQII